MSVLQVWIPACVWNKTHFANPLVGMRYLVGTVLAKKFDPRKKIPLRTHGAPAARKKAFRSLHKPPKNDFFETWSIKISCQSQQMKLIREKKLRFARTLRPPRAKMCPTYYIRDLKTAVLRLGPLK